MLARATEAVGTTRRRLPDAPVTVLLAPSDTGAVASAVVSRSGRRIPASSVTVTVSPTRRASPMP